jgi:hypothetical protein
VQDRRAKLLTERVGHSLQNPVDLVSGQRRGRVSFAHVTFLRSGK